MAPNSLGGSSVVLSATSEVSKNYRDKHSRNVVADVNSSPIKTTEQNVSAKHGKKMQQQPIV